MKYISSFFTLVLIVAVLTGCKKDEEEAPDNLQIVIEKISGTWSVSYAELDGNGLTEAFTGLQITTDSDLLFSTNSSTVERQPNPWAESGSFTLPDEITSTDNVLITRNDGVVLSLLFITETNVQITFNFNNDNIGSNGRVSAVSGDWVFEFEKI
ncbi:hypothetical protein [Fulvivirga sp.]|uniref:hypothetical protein n=1 Tax=Fulvivirga sp. TaxID=1931237 RepID=UPI0032ED2CCC